MKNTTTPFALFALLILPITSSFAQASDMITVSPDQTFIPKAFDSNDNVQIVMHGRYHGVCDRVAPYEFKVDQDQQKITLTNRAYTTPNCVSILVNTPYTVVVNLGSLPDGNYRVYTTNADSSETFVDTLPVKTSTTPSIDNHIYAQVDEVNTVKMSEAQVLPIVLKGVTTNTCLSLDSVTAVLRGNVYDVLPVMKQTGTNCQSVNIPFEKSVSLTNFPKTPTLINVRAMGGQSVERVIDYTGLLN